MIVIDYDKCCWKDGKCVSSCCGEKCDGCVEACPAGALERKDIVVLISRILLIDVWFLEMLEHHNGERVFLKK